MCRSLQISRSWWYEQKKRVYSHEEDIALRDEIEQIVLEFPGYGYRRVTHALKWGGQSEAGVAGHA